MSFWQGKDRIKLLFDLYRVVQEKVIRVASPPVSDHDSEQRVSEIIFVIYLFQQSSIYDVACLFSIFIQNKIRTLAFCKVCIIFFFQNVYFD